MDYFHGLDESQKVFALFQSYSTWMRVKELKKKLELSLSQSCSTLDERTQLI
jgi:hypothetical protein